MSIRKVTMAKQPFFLPFRQNKQRHSNLNVDTQEAIRGLTALMVTCRRGHRPTTKMLLSSGAGPFVKDFRAWSAKDNVAFKGWEIIVSDLMAMDLKFSIDKSPVPPTFKWIPTCSGFPPYMKDNSPSEFARIFVNLGALDTYKRVSPVDFSPLTSPKAFDLQNEGESFLEVRSLTEDQPSYTIQLPIMEEMANKPLRFNPRHPEIFTLDFDVYESPGFNRDKRLRTGWAIALLEELEKGLGEKSESLTREFTIAITATDTLDCVGRLTFYFLLVTPFRGLPTKTSAKQKLHLADHGKPIVIGHRDKNRRPSLMAA